jgi:hypothetical protein
MQTESTQVATISESVNSELHTSAEQGHDTRMDNQIPSRNADR